MPELSPLSLIAARQDRLEHRLSEVAEEADAIPVLHKEVEMLTKAVDRNTNALYTVVGTVVATAIIFLLLQKGVIG